MVIKPAPLNNLSTVGITWIRIVVRVGNTYAVVRNTINSEYNRPVF